VGNLRGKRRINPSRVVTGWDISGCEGKGKPVEEKKVEEKAEQAKATFTQLTRHLQLSAKSREEHIAQHTSTLWAAMTETLNWHAK